MAYKPRHIVRFVTAASLFDGHDVSINLMRRMLQSSGVEVIHLGHNRSVQEIVDTAIQEDVQGIAVSSYQGGHVEYFKYMYDMLREQGAGHIKIFGGGGGVIVPEEISELHAYGITKIFSPDDGMTMGLQGMIDFMLDECDFSTKEAEAATATEAPSRTSPYLTLAGRLTEVELQVADTGEAEWVGETLRVQQPVAPVIGITGTGGAGKSTLTDELVRRFLNDFDDLKLAILSVDPSKRLTGGALLGDRIRMNAIYGKNASRVYMRSFATRQAHRATSRALRASIDVCRHRGFGLIFLETAGIGQSDTEITDLTDLSIYVMTHDFGAPTQLEKIGMLDVADFVALNKFEKRGSVDALRDIRKQVQRNRGLWDQSPDTMPVFPTRASQFNDAGVTRLYLALLDTLNERQHFGRISTVFSSAPPEPDPVRSSIIDSNRQRYLGEVANDCRAYRSLAERQIELARKWGEASGALRQLAAWNPDDAEPVRERLEQMQAHSWERLDPRSREILTQWDEMAEQYAGETFTYRVRGRDITVPLFTSSLSGTPVPRVALPRTRDAGEQLRFALLENLPGFFPYTAGVFPFKRTGEDPTRMFAGEGSPERTNRRFHLVSAGMPARRLSTRVRLRDAIRLRPSLASGYLWEDWEFRRFYLHAG